MAIYATRAARYIVTITTDPETAAEGFAERAGTDIYGPFLFAEAQRLADEIRTEFSTHASEEFLYGEATVDISPVRTQMPTAWDAVKNWVDPEWETTIESQNN